VLINTISLFLCLRYKPESRGFDSPWCNWNFSLTSFRPHYGPGVDSTSNRHEYQEYFLGGKGGRCVGLTNLPPSCADCLEIWEPQPPGTLRVCPGLEWDCFTFLFPCSSENQFEFPVISSYINIDMWEYQLQFN